MRHDGDEDEDGGSEDGVEMSAVSWATLDLEVEQTQRHTENGVRAAAQVCGWVACG